MRDGLLLRHVVGHQFEQFFVEHHKPDKLDQNTVPATSTMFE